jgi:protein-S-isoprenylcysteine O-methyltransferase Ste14
MSGCGKPNSVQRGRYGRVFKLIYFAGMLAQIILRMPYERQRRQIPKIDQRFSRTERGLLVVLSLWGFFIPLIYSLTSWLDFANYRWSPATKARVGSIGTVLLGAAIWLFWRSHRDLGKNWSPSLEISAQQTLITHGVYRTIRHPMYASGWLLSLAQALLLQNWVAGPAGVVAFLPLYFLRVPREEQMMVDHFGDDYRSYAAQTGRILPRLRG